MHGPRILESPYSPFCLGKQTYPSCLPLYHSVCAFVLGPSHLAALLPASYQPMADHKAKQESCVLQGDAEKRRLCLRQLVLEDTAP
jgi:hypothetical protein